MNLRRGAVLAAAALLASGLPARAQPATWVATFPVQEQADERIEAASDGAVWAVIDHSRVLRSVDGGRTWVQATAPSLVEAATGVGGPPGGGSSDTYVAPVSATVALGANANAFHETRDGGVTWKPVPVPRVTKPGGMQGVQLLRRLQGRYWAAMDGSEIVHDCPVPVRSTPLLSSVDGRHWARSDIRTPNGSVRSLAFADRQHGAASVYEFNWKTTSDSSGCGYEGGSNTTGIYVTSDGGRTWHRRFACTPSCTLDWGTAQGHRRLTAVRADGVVFDSTDDARSFRRTATLPTDIFSAFATACVADRCWEIVLGNGIFRRDGSGEWVEETSVANAPGLCVPHLAVLDREHAVAAGPNALFVRTSMPAAVTGPARPTASEVALGAGLVDATGRLRVQHRGVAARH